jgi:hypothetical protein
MFYPTVSSFFAAEGDFAENLIDQDAIDNLTDDEVDQALHALRNVK